MRIGIFIDSSYPAGDGTARNVQAQVIALQAHGHTVIVFCGEGSISYTNVVRITTKYSWFTPTGSLVIQRGLVDKIIELYKFDIIHSQSDGGAVILAHQVAKQLGVPHVHTFHGSYSFLYQYYRWHTSWMIMTAEQRLKELHASHIKMPRELKGYYSASQFIHRRNWQSLATIASVVDYYITPMPYMHEGLQQLVPSSKGKIIPTGVDVSTFGVGKRTRPADAPMRAIYLGRVSQEKRSTVVMEAYLQAAKQIVGLELTVIGAGNELPKLRRMAKRSGLANRVRLLGVVEDQKVIAQELAEADVFTMPTYPSGSQDLAVLEAAAASLPIVYCDENIQAGTSPKNAILTKPDSKSLADGLVRIASNRELAKQMGSASRAIADMFSTERVEQQHILIYESLLKK